MPTTISFTPRLPPRLMICSSAGISDSAPSRPKRLVPVNLRSQNSQTLGFDQLVQDRAPALAGKTDFLVGAFDTFLNPGLLRAVGDVHELDAERLAVSALADRDDLPQARVFHAEHMIEEDLAVEITFREAVGARIEFLAIARRFDPERVELGVEMAAHAIGADQHQRAHRVAGRLMDVGRRYFGALWPAPWPRFCRRPPSRPRPSCHRARRSDRLAGSAASCCAPRTVHRRSLYVSRGVFQAFEEFLPFGVDRAGILLVAGRRDRRCRGRWCLAKMRREQMLHLRPDET